MKVTNKRTEICRYWQRGDCQNGSRCMFAHGMTQLRKPEIRGEHPEDLAIRAAIEKGGPEPAELRVWRAELEKIAQHGGKQSYSNLRPTARWAIHQLATGLGLQHLSTGIGDQRTLHVCAPPARKKEEAPETRMSPAVLRRRMKKERTRRGRVGAHSGIGADEDSDSRADEQGASDKDSVSAGEEVVDGNGCAGFPVMATIQRPPV